MAWRRYAVIACLLASAGSARAGDDALTSCRSERGAADRLAACTAVVESAEFSAGERAVAFRLRGLERLGAGALDDALADLSQALSLAPNDAAAYAARAKVHLAAGSYDAAVTDFSAALDNTSDRKAKVALLIGRGHTLMVKGLFDAALGDLDAAIAINPKSASAYNHRGLVYRKKADTARAIEEYTVAIALNPVYALAYSNRGHAYESLGNRKEAIRDFSRALLLDGSLTSASERLKALDAGSVLVGESERLVAEGRDLAERTCAFCHAVGLKGASPNAKAPAFRTLAERHPELSLREPLSRGVLAPHDVMPNFSLTDREVDGLVAYINTLGE
jgi:tetratricopeptide (TPR) repeat protein